MTYFEVKIYCYYSRKAICTAVFQNQESLDKFIQTLSSDIDIIQLGDIVFRKKDFAYAEINEKIVK